MIRRSPHWRLGFSLIEVVVATALVGMLMVAALKAQQNLTRSRAILTDRGAAWLLAQDLMSEILMTNYKELVETPTFGPEASEIGPTRANYDDVDDYNGYTASPPQYKDGSVVPNRTGFQESVVVQYVDPANVSSTISTDQGAKRIVVTITKNGTTLTTLTAVRTQAWQQPPYDLPSG